MARFYTPKGTPISQRLELQTVPVAECGCWIWMGKLNQYGYGRINIGGAYQGTHRVSWEVHRGKIPDGLHVLHHCDIRSCINPDHLFIGTDADNVRDCIKKGRARHVGMKGEKHHKAKVTAKQVLMIRTSQKKPKFFIEKFGLSKSQVSAIRTKRSWSHI
jgi:hypothetical protein